MALCYQVDEQARAASAAEQRASARHLECVAQIGRSTLMVHNSQREVLHAQSETSSLRDQLLQTESEKDAVIRTLEAQRVEIYRLKMEARSIGPQEAPKPKYTRTTRVSTFHQPPPEGVRTASEDLVRSLNELCTTAHSTSSIPSLESITNDDDISPTDLSDKDSRLFALVLRCFHSHLGPRRLLEVVRGMLPATFYLAAGLGVNASLKSFASAIGDKPWRILWEIMPQPFKILVASMLQTRQSASDALSPVYEHRLFAHTMTIFSISMITLNPSCNGLLQRDMTLAVKGAFSRTVLLEVLSKLGITNSISTASGSRESKPRISRQIFEKYMEVWSNRLNANVALEYDNLDIMKGKTSIHVLCGAFFLLDPVNDANLSGINRQSISQLTAETLAHARPIEVRVAHALRDARSRNGALLCQDSGQEAEVCRTVSMYTQPGALGPIDAAVTQQGRFKVPRTHTLDVQSCVRVMSLMDFDSNGDPKYEVRGSRIVVRAQECIYLESIILKPHFFK